MNQSQQTVDYEGVSKVWSRGWTGKSPNTLLKPLTHGAGGTHGCCVPDTFFKELLSPGCAVWESHFTH